jgi:hypothetical protein
MNGPIALNKTGKYDFTKLKEVPEDSLEAKLYGIIDDIDTAIDVFKPDICAYERYVIRKIGVKDDLIVSDGYKLYYTNQPKKGE